MDQDLHGSVEGVLVGQCDHDALGRASRGVGVGSDLVCGALNSCPGKPRCQQVLKMGRDQGEEMTSGRGQEPTLAPALYW